jgi:hypothetical protein
MQARGLDDKQKGPFVRKFLLRACPWGFPKRLSSAPGTICRDEPGLAIGPGESSFTRPIRPVVIAVGGVRQGSAKFVSGAVWKLIDDLLNLHVDGQPAEDVVNPNAHPPGCRPAGTRLTLGVRFDSMAVIFAGWPHD